MLTQTKKKIIEELVAEVVNATMPSNDQMITVRLIRNLLPPSLDTLEKEVKKQMLIKTKIKFDAWLIMPSVDHEKMTRAVYKSLIDEINSLDDKNEKE